MFDASKMYPKGFHPVHKNFDPAYKRVIYPNLQRCETEVKYYFIDFGLSNILESWEKRFVTGVYAQDATIPELSSRVPYDALAVDVYTLGNTYKEFLLKVVHVLHPFCLMILTLQRNIPCSSFCHRSSMP